MTPYSAQKNKILEMMKGLDEPLADLKVASITESQGLFTVHYFIYHTGCYKVPPLVLSKEIGQNSLLT